MTFAQRLLDEYNRVIKETNTFPVWRIQTTGIESRCPVLLVEDDHIIIQLHDKQRIIQLSAIDNVDIGGE